MSSMYVDFTSLYVTLGSWSKKKKNEINDKASILLIRAVDGVYVNAHY